LQKRTREVRPGPLSWGEVGGEKQNWAYFVAYGSGSRLKKKPGGTQRSEGAEAGEGGGGDSR